jgi:hypothetical protein
MAAPTPLSIARGLRPKPRYGQNRDASVVIQRAKWKANVAMRGRMSMTSDTSMDRILGAKAGVCAGTCTPVCPPLPPLELKSSVATLLTIPQPQQQPALYLYKWNVSWHPIANSTTMFSLYDIGNAPISSDVSLVSDGRAIVTTSIIGQTSPFYFLHITVSTACGTVTDSCKILLWIKHFQQTTTTQNGLSYTFQFTWDPVPDTPVQLYMYNNDGSLPPPITEESIDARNGRATIVSPGPFSDTQVTLNMTTGCCSAAANVSLCYPFTIQNLTASEFHVSYDPDQNRIESWKLTWDPVANTYAEIEVLCTSSYVDVMPYDRYTGNVPIEFGLDGASAKITIISYPDSPPLYNPRANLTLYCLFCPSYSQSASVRLPGPAG